MTLDHLADDSLRTRAQIFWKEDIRKNKLLTKEYVYVII